jgi:hypothetical protein
MELLLNLVWLFLALPAWWLWRGRGPSRKFSSLQCLLALGCLLVILFPVVSATDDLCAMRAEIEESPAGKRSIHASHDKPSGWKWQSPPALAASGSSLIVNDEAWQPLPKLGVSVSAAPAIERAGRAPPDCLIA